MARPGSDLFNTIFGRDAQPLAAQPATGLQRLVVRNLSPSLGVSKWAMAGLGAVVAAVVALILSAIIQAPIDNAISSAVNSAFASSPLTQGLGGSISGFLSLNTIQVLALTQGVPLVAHLSASAGGGGISASVSGDITLHLPLSGMLLLPAVALIIGGYISAASDFQRRARYSIARGALMGPMYAVLLAILSFFGTTSISIPNITSVSGGATLGPSVGQAFLLGLLFGVVFGALGGWIQVAGGAFLTGALPTLRASFGQSLRDSRIAGALAGSVVTLVCAIGVFSGLLAGLVSFAGVSAAASTSSTSTVGLPGAPSGLSPVLTVILLIVYLPVLAIYLFGASAGGTIDVYTTSSAAIGSTAQNVHHSYGLFTGQYPLPTSTHQWFYLLVLIPIICYLAGGRTAAKVTGARTTSDGFVVGALMAVPACLVFALAALLVGVGADISVGVVGQTVTTSSGVGPAVWGTLLAVLIGGAIVGGIGGASAVGAPWLGSIPRYLAVPLKPIGLALDPLLDALSGRPRSQPRSLARQWVYEAILVGLVLAVVGVALDIVNVALARTLPFQQMILVDAIVAALLVCLPLLLLTGALVTAFSASADLLAAQPMPGYAVPGYPMAVPMTVPAAAPADMGYAPGYPPMAMPAAPYPMTGPMPAVPYSAPATTPAPYAPPASSPVPYPPPTAPAPIPAPYTPPAMDPPSIPFTTAAPYPGPTLAPLAAPAPDPAGVDPYAPPSAPPAAPYDPGSVLGPSDPFSSSGNPPASTP